MILPKSIDSVRQQVSIQDVIALYAKLERSGGKYKCCCPLHNEKTASLIINSAANTWHCFGCGEGGDAIAFIQKKEGLSFPDAIRFLAKKFNIYIEEDARVRTQEEKESDQLREAMLSVYSTVQRYFSANLHNQDEESRTAYQYAVNRWGNKFVEEAGIGYAYNSFNHLLAFAKQSAISTKLLSQMGLIKTNDKGNTYDFFRGRIMIPIRDRYGRIIAYTARTLSEDSKESKYINTPSNILYRKSQTVFGLDQASRAAAKDETYVLVEGAPDVLRLQSIGVWNAVASLGSDWTNEQLHLLQRNAHKLLFLPDADAPKAGNAYGTGIQKVIKSAMQAWELGFEVSVKEIPLGADSRKQDPDSYCKSLIAYSDLPIEEFPIWYAKKLVQAGEMSHPDIVSSVSALIARLEKPHEIDHYVNQLNDVIKSKSMWNKAVRSAQRTRCEAALKSETQNHLDINTFDQYGFQAQGNCYISIGQNGKIMRWSNFIMNPLFHVSDGTSAVRLFEVVNEDGDKSIVEFKTEDLVSLSRFKQKVESIGNYVWLAKEDQLTKLKLFLFKVTEKAEPIYQLGWQSQGFYAFGNGIFDGRTWQTVDKFGIVRLPDGNFYLPAFSSIYERQKSLYQFERSFVHHNLGATTLRQYTQMMIEVFGDNAKIGISFLLATLFRDVVTAQTKSFPILNIFGPKGSGKSELGHSLMSFFIIENTPPNIQNSTLPALADAVAQCANALVHIDEFKNTIDIDKREFLKGLWDGTGRNRMNMDKDKKREVTRVDSGIILSGQEMATADIALFSRFIFLRYNKSEFSTEAKANFQRLKDMRKVGCTHLTLEILSHRALVEAEYAHSYNRVRQDIIAALNGAPVEDRISNNWASAIAAYHCLRDKLDLPFTYQDVLAVAVNGIREQNSETKQNNELSTFWDIVNYLREEGQIVAEGTFRIELTDKFKADHTQEMIFQKPKKILYLRYKPIFEQYQIHGRKIGETLLPKKSLGYYIENSPAYMGKKHGYRFSNIIQGQQQTTTVNTGAYPQYKKESVVDQAYCFDYDKVVELYGVNLEVVLED